MPNHWFFGFIGFIEGFGYFCFGLFDSLVFDHLQPSPKQGIVLKTRFFDFFGAFGIFWLGLLDSLVFVRYGFDKIG